jgi:hypothetical protein
MNLREAMPGQAIPKTGYRKTGIPDAVPREGKFLAAEDLTASGRGFAGTVQQSPAKPVIAAVEGYAPWSSGSRNRGKEVEAQRF